MDRRGFLLRGAMAVMALGIDPEELLWTPKKEFSFATMPGMLPALVTGFFRKAVHIDGLCQVDWPSIFAETGDLSHMPEEPVDVRLATANEVAMAVSGKDYRWYVCK